MAFVVEQLEARVALDELLELFSFLGGDPVAAGRRLPQVRALRPPASAPDIGGRLLRPDRDRQLQLADQRLRLAQFLQVRLARLALHRRRQLE